MELEFIKTIFESRMFSSKNSYKRFTAEEVAEAVYLCFLGLVILKNEFKTSRFAIDYMYETFRYKDLTRISLQATDLHQMLFSLQSKNADWFKDSKNSEVELKKIKINLDAVLAWVIRVIKVKTTPDMDRRFLIMLEKQLNIGASEYKNIRILVGEWEFLTITQQQLATTRLLLAFRKKLPLCDLYSKIEFISNVKNLKIYGVTNPEKEKKKPVKNYIKKKLAEDVSVTTSCNIASVSIPLMVTKRMKKVKK